MQKKVIFIVEDDKDTLEMLTLLLQKDFIVYPFREAGIEFQENLRANTPHLVLLDFITPGANTTDTIKLIKDQYNDQVKIILVTGISEKNIPKDLKIDSYMAKPFQIKDLRKMIGQLLLIELP